MADWMNRKLDNIKVGDKYSAFHWTLYTVGTDAEVATFQHRE